ncbi:protein kinase, partial [Actinomadura sp. DSM 109109]|nr:protein kinase [Actinomadura lepetitiana]
MDWRLTGFTEERELGRGAQGRVVLARHTESGTPVAIKYLTGGDPAAVAGLRSEAQMLGRLTSPYVARLYQFVEGAGGAAIVMEAVNGASLKEVLRENGALAPEAALLVLKGSLLGLAAAHAVGVVHRDYKPANVVVRGDGLSKLVDFGIAVLSGGSSISGTPVYMAPEQWRGEPAGPATDVYAATCVFVECVTGRRPFASADRAALMNQHLSAPVDVREVPGPLRPLVLQGMAKDPGERPPGAAEFVTRLESAAAAAYGGDWEQRGTRALAAAAVALAALFPLGALALTPGATAAAGATAGAAGTAGTAGAGGA